MINQVTEAGNTGDILYFMRVLFFIALLSMGYELSRPQTISDKEQALLLDDSSVSSKEQQWPSLLPWQKNASEKAVERYIETQEKKWRRWNEAMFERST